MPTSSDRGVTDMANPLLVTPDQATATTGATGAGFFDSWSSAGNAFGSGDWAEGLVNAGGVGLDVLALAADPLAGLISWGVGWLIEHVSFLREPFDALMGNPDAIQALSQTWQNVGQELRAVADDYRDFVQSQTVNWQGIAGDAYRTVAGAHAAGIDAAGVAGQGMAVGVAGAGAVVGTVRGIVRDLISGAIGDIASAVIKWGVATVATAGIALGGAIADAIRIAVKWAKRISEWMSKLGKVLQNAVKRLDELGSTGTTARKGLEKLVKNVNKPNQTELNIPTIRQADLTPDGIMRGDVLTPRFGLPTRGVGADENAAFRHGGDYGASKGGLEGAKEATKVDDTLYPEPEEDQEQW